MLDQKVTVSELKEKVDRFISEREWNKYHKPKDLSISIVLESSELLEHFQWLTDDEIETMLKDSPETSAEIWRKKCSRLPEGFWNKCMVSQCTTVLDTCSHRRISSKSRVLQ